MKRFTSWLELWSYVEREARKRIEFIKKEKGGKVDTKDKVLSQT
jgi:hypothetical protein